MYSKDHVKIDANAEPDKYFDYSFFEIGSYDLPAMVDFIRNKTGKSKIAFLGHSQGATSMYSALAYNQGEL